MNYSYRTTNTCCKEIRFNIDGNKVHNVEFLGGGCPGNLKALPKLIEGMEKEEVIKRLEGVTCGMKNTSCANELVKALKEV